MTAEQLNKIDWALRTGLEYCIAAERDLKPNQADQAKRDIQMIRDGIAALKEAAR